MRIVIDNSGYDLLNLGDVAMLQVAVQRLLELFAGAAITVVTERPDRLARFCPGVRALSPEGRRIWARDRNIFGPLHRVLPTGPLSRLENDLRNRWPRMMGKWISRRLADRGEDTRAMHAFLHEITSADLVVCSGGGFITDAFAFHAIHVLHTLDLAASLGIPTALFGQGIGPVKDHLLAQKARRVLGRVRLIAVREAIESPALLDAWHLDPARVEVTGDDAVQPAYDLRAAKRGVAIGVNIRTASYAQLPPAAMQAAKQALAAAAARLGAPLIPAPISFYNDGEDMAAARALIGDAAAANIETPGDLIRQIAQCRVVVTGAYHAGVFALAQGIPVVGLAQSDYYQSKFDGLADQFGVGCAILRLDRPDLPEALAGAIDRAWSSAEQTREPLLAAARRQIRASQAAYARFASMLDTAPQPAPGGKAVSA